MIRFTDTFEDERGGIVTAPELFLVWNDMRNKRETELKFQDYVADCCGKNGTLRRLNG